MAARIRAAAAMDATMNVRLALHLLIVVLPTLFAGSVEAANPDFCADYARSAVSQADALTITGCFKGFDGGWHLDYGRHYAWCITAAPDAVDAQRNNRRTRLAQCQNSGG
jgi:hypothetical protein